MNMQSAIAVKSNGTLINNVQRRSLPRKPQKRKQKLRLRLVPLKRRQKLRLRHEQLKRKRKLTLPLVLPPTVVGYLLLRVFGPKRVIGAWVLETFGVKMVMTWWSAIFATVVVIFPLMYRTVRGAFESFDETLAYSGQTLGLSNTYIFWRIRMPYCRQGVLAGTVLAFARALGEYGATSMIAGYTPGKTATISTTVYQLWQTNNDVLATKWVLVNIAISAVVLLAVNMLERRDFLTDASKARRARR